MNEEMGGEATCYHSHADLSGRILSHEDRISIGRNVEDAIPVVIERKAETIGVLAPGRDESIEQYRERLERPVERTAAWVVALRAMDAPVRLISGDDVDQEHLQVLQEYLHTLIQEA
jgi:hypothetical protein